MQNKKPPFTITEKILTDVMEICELVGKVSSTQHLSSDPVLRRQNRIKTIYSSLAIEQNTLSLEQVTAVLSGKRVLAPPKDIAEVKNAYEIYDHLNKLNPYSVEDLLLAHHLMMRGLVQEDGVFRSKPVGAVDSHGNVLHFGTLPQYVPPLVEELLKWIEDSPLPMLIKSCVFHYTFEEKFVSVPEQGGGKLIPDGMCNPGQIYTVSRGKSGMIGVFRLESQMLPGSGKFERTGLGSDRDCRESTNTAFNFLKANGNRISGGISTASKDYIINYQDLQGIGMTGKLALPTLIALCSIALGRPTVSTLAVLGEISISGTILKVDELANSLQVCLDSGAKKVLLPISSAVDLGTVPPELVGSFNLIFYSSAEDAVFKALGVE